MTAPAFSRGRAALLFGREPARLSRADGTAAGHGGPRDGCASRYLGERIAVAGDRLVFSQQDVVRHTDLQSDLYAVPVDGGATRRLTREARATRSGRRARWPHDRLHRAADRPPDSCHSRRAATGAFGRAGAIRRLRHSTEFSSPRWSPDGRVIAAERRRLGGPSDIVVVDVATRSVRTLVTSEQGRNFGPMWLPDGATILFSSDRGGTPFGIYGADVATGAVRSWSEQDPVHSFRHSHRMGAGSSSSATRLMVTTSTRCPSMRRSGQTFQASAPDSHASVEIVDRAPAGGAGDAPYRPWSTLAPRYWVPVIESDARRCPDRREHERVRCARAPRLRRDRNVGGSTKRSQLAGRLLATRGGGPRCSRARPTAPRTGAPATFARAR